MPFFCSSNFSETCWAKTGVLRKTIANNEKSQLKQNTKGLDWPYTCTRVYSRGHNEKRKVKLNNINIYLFIYLDSS